MASRPSSSEPAEARDEQSDDRDPLKRKIAVSLAAVVVLGGGLAILKTEAGVNESNTARETTRLAVRAMAANVSLSSVLGVQSELLAERDFLPFRRPLNTGGEKGALQAARRSLPPALAQSRLDRLRFDSERQALGQRALAKTRITWNTRATQYQTVIALLAAALFLIGFGLIVEGSIRKYSYGVGLTIAVFAAGWGVWLYQLSIPSTSAAALDATAHGAVFTANGDYGDAIGSYARAIAAAGDYEAAYAGRARARLLAANPDFRDSTAVTASGSALAADVRDAERALELDGKRDQLAHALVALVSFYRGDYSLALSAGDGALAINPRVPDIWLLRSATEAALGDTRGARDSLTEALRLVAGAQSSERIRGLAASYLSYLARVSWRDPERAGVGGRLARRMVAAETGITLGARVTGRRPRTGGVTVDNLRYIADRLSFVLRWQSLPRKVALSVIEYERPLTGGAWSQAADLASFSVIHGTGERRVSVKLRRVCKPTAVRVDAYLDGVPTAVRVGSGVKPTC